MVEPRTLTLGTIVAALAAEAAERPPGAESALALLVGAMHRRFDGDDEPARDALAQVESRPDSSPDARRLAAIVDERTAWDTRLRTELARLVAQARDEGLDVNAIVQVVGGQIAQEISLRASQATVTHSRPPPPPGRPGL